MKKPMIIATSIATVGLAAALGVGAVSAATTSTGHESLIDKLVTKFHLNKADVQQVFDQQRTENQADHTVTEGKITQDQETKILAKLAEEQTFHDSIKDKSEADRRAAMKTHRVELQKWATDNGIDIKYLFGGRGRHMGGHMRGGMLGGAPDSN